MKELILADIHGNFPALEAVIKKETPFDEMLFLGDAPVHGPQPDEVLSLLSRYKANGVFLMGNHDQDIINIDPDRPQENPNLQWMQWVKKQLSPQNMEFLKSFIPPCVVERQGCEMMLLHGDLPVKLGKRIWPDSPDEVFAFLAAQYPQPYILLGHSHIQFQKKYNNTTFINPGTVGQPRLGPYASYVILENGRFDLRAIPLDTDRVCTLMDKVPLDKGFIEEWKQAYRTGSLPERYKIRDFTPLYSMDCR